METVLRPVRRRVGAGAARVWRRVEDDEAEGQQCGGVCGGGHFCGARLRLLFWEP